MESRREFIGAAAAALTPLALAKPRVLGANDRINVGVIGAGSMGFGHVRLLKKHADGGGNIQVAAVSDVYSKRKLRAREFLSLPEKDIHHDYRDLIARPEIDAVFVATPDHWHFHMAMDALEAGKDVYVQKPMTYKIEEAKIISEYVRKSGRVLQVGSQYASEPQYFKAREAIAQGLIGKPLYAQGTYSRNSFKGEWNYRIDNEGTPENIDWRRFLGSAPKRAFSQDRFFRWRKYWDYSGGIATDLLYHRLVPFLVALGPQFPVRVSSNGGIFLHKDREVPDTVSTTIEYADFQVSMASSMASDLVNAHVRPVICGHEGSIAFLGKEIVITPDPIYAKKFEEKAGQKEIRIAADARDLQTLHMENFFDCMRSRKKPNLDAEFGYQAMVAIGLGVEAFRESKQMAFDPQTGKILKIAQKRPGYEGDGKNHPEDYS
ncbi:MAG: Gfo/Idh/MocA family oxidoreductase [Bryobacterales bacterium]|nr:Gfo/Idh/MocA family oxidoreductase [Bryobacterales bacterium]